MDAHTLQGIVYLVLFCAAGAGLWIYALHRMLGRAWRQVAALETERDQLERKLLTLATELETRDMNDEELLDELTGMLSSRPSQTHTTAPRAGERKPLT